MRHLLLIILLSCVLACSAPAFAECVSGNCVNGQGTYNVPDVGTYVGQWKDGFMVGQGTMTFLNGSKYDGQYKDGKLLP